MRMEEIWLGKRRKWNGRNKIGKRREWPEGIRLGREENGRNKVEKRENGRNKVGTRRGYGNRVKNIIRKEIICPSPLTSRQYHPWNLIGADTV